MNKNDEERLVAIHVYHSTYAIADIPWLLDKVSSLASENASLKEEGERLKKALKIINEEYHGHNGKCQTCPYRDSPSCSECVGTIAKAALEGRPQ